MNLRGLEVALRKSLLIIPLLVLNMFICTASAGDMHEFLIKTFATYMTNEEYSLENRCYALNSTLNQKTRNEVLDRLTLQQANKLVRDCEALKANETKQSSTEEVEYFRKAAEQGDAIAQYNLGLLYAKGGVDPVWWTL